MAFVRSLIGAAAATAVLASTAALAADVNGVWLVEAKTAKVEIYDCDSKKCGKIVWLEEPLDENGQPKLDTENKDEAKQKQPIIGSIMIWDMEPDGDNKWDDGTIYRANDGKEFSSEMELKDENTLGVSGCVAFFCKEQTWTRSSL